MRVKKPTTKDQVSTRLREIRINNRLTQKEMGEIINMTAGSVGALENGLYTPNYDVLRMLKKKLNVSYDYILDGENNISNDVVITENKDLKEEVARLKKMVDRLLK